MSLDPLAWALARQGLRPAAKLTLITLADLAGADWRCWPSNETLAAATGLSARHIGLQLAALERLGLISVNQRNGRPVRPGRIVTIGRADTQRRSLATGRPA